jgi:hypothetical protein
MEEFCAGKDDKTPVSPKTQKYLRFFTIFTGKGSFGIDLDYP